MAVNYNRPSVGSLNSKLKNSFQEISPGRASSDFIEEYRRYTINFGLFQNDFEYGSQGLEKAGYLEGLLVDVR